jgi:hypothetical protein
MYIKSTNIFTCPYVVISRGKALTLEYLMEARDLANERVKCEVTLLKQTC